MNDDETDTINVCFPIGPAQLLDELSPGLIVLNGRPCLKAEHPDGPLYFALDDGKQVEASDDEMASQISSIDPFSVMEVIVRNMPPMYGAKAKRATGCIEPAGEQLYLAQTPERDFPQWLPISKINEKGSPPPYLRDTPDEVMEEAEKTFTPLYNRPQPGSVKAVTAISYTAANCLNTIEEMKRFLQVLVSQSRDSRNVLQ